MGEVRGSNRSKANTRSPIRGIIYASSLDGFLKFVEGFGLSNSVTPYSFCQFKSSIRQRCRLGYLNSFDEEICTN